MLKHLLKLPTENGGYVLLNLQLLESIVVEPLQTKSRIIVHMPKRPQWTTIINLTVGELADAINEQIHLKNEVDNQ